MLGGGGCGSPGGQRRPRLRASGQSQREGSAQPQPPGPTQQFTRKKYEGDQSRGSAAFPPPCKEHDKRRSPLPKNTWALGEEEFEDTLPPCWGPACSQPPNPGPAAPRGDAAGPRGCRQPLWPPWLHGQRAEPSAKQNAKKKMIKPRRAAGPASLCQARCHGSSSLIKGWH